MRKRTAVAGLGAALIAILSIITLGLIRTKKGNKEEE